MDDSKLREIGGQLEVSQTDIRSLKRLQKREKQVYRIHKKTARLLKKISIALGLTYGAVFVALDEAAYPYGPDYPGGPLIGRLLPIIGFGAGASASGLIYSWLRKRKKGPLVIENGVPIAKVFYTVLFTFSAYYIFSYIFISFFTASLYGAFAHEEDGIRG